MCVCKWKCGVCVCVIREWNAGSSRAQVWGQMQDWEGDEEVDRPQPQGLAWLVDRAGKTGRQVK